MSTAVHDIKDPLSPKGQLELFVTRGKPNLILSQRVANPYNIPLYSSCDIDFSGCEILDSLKQQNRIVNKGKDAVIESLTTGMVKTLARLAIGSEGTNPTDQTIAKQPEASRTELYHEVGRSDAEAIILNTGTESIHQVRLVKTFSAVNWLGHMGAFSNQANPVVNEVGLIMVNLAEAPLPRDDNFGPYVGSNHPKTDEVLFAIRTHKSVPFEASGDISITIRYTIYIE